MRKQPTRMQRLVCWLKYGHQRGGAFYTHCERCGQVFPWED